MKKKLVMAMALAMTLVLAGCGGTGTGEGAQGSGAGSSPAATESSASQADKESGEAKESSQENSTSASGAGTENSQTAASGAGTESGQQDGMVSAGSKEDMGIDESWKGVYADFLDKELNNLIGEYDEDWQEGWSFGFIYLNDDPTPELVLSSGYEAAGNIICSIVDGKVAFVQTSRLNFFYKEFGGIFDNSDGNMGYYHDYVYSLGNNGFELLHEGNNYADYDQEGNITETNYIMDGSSVTKEKYEKTICDLLPAEDRIFWAKGCTYGDMMDYLKGNTAKDYKEAYRKVIKDGVQGSSGELNMFALIDRTNYEPLLLCAGDQEFCLYAFEDGLLQKGPTSYFSETTLRLIYPQLGILESSSYYENNEMYDAFYHMRAGSLLANYAISNSEYDENWEPKKDADGNLITIYTVNQVETTKDQFSKYVSRYDEVFKQQLVSPKEDYTFIEYSNATQMYDLLSK